MIVGEYLDFRTRLFCAHGIGHEMSMDSNLNSKFDTEITDAKKQIAEYTTQMNIYLFNDYDNPEHY